MSAPVWLLPSFVALIFWGVYTFLPKLGVRHLRPLHLLVYQTCFFFLTCLVIQAVHGVWPSFEIRGTLLALVAGFTGTVGTLFYVIALRNGPVGYVSVITSLYPLVSTGLAVLFLGETLRPQQLLGILLGICAILLLMQEKKA